MNTVHPKVRCGLMFLFFVSVCSGGFTAPRQEEENIDYAVVRSNPILRHVLSANAPYADTSTAESIEYKFRENWVDTRVDHFVKETYRKLSELKASVQSASSASSDLTGQDSEKRAQALARLRQALIQAEDQSKDLRSRLSMVLVDLACKDKFNVTVNRDARGSGFKVEIESLSEQTANAERFIRDFFFKPTHVTSVADLKEANMLDYLKRVERIARAIRDKL